MTVDAIVHYHHFDCLLADLLSFSLAIYFDNA